MRPLTIAYFVTPHGFGHASRSAAVMAAMLRISPSIRFEIFTTCPDWIFADTLNTPFGFHRVQTDIGMVQASPIREDIAATQRALNRYLPFNVTLVNDLSERLRQLQCRLVICDISALGIAAAQKAGLPSVLVESFTWDWIYSAYVPAMEGLSVHCRYLRKFYDQVDIRIQTEPLCQLLNGSLQVAPISRRPRTDPMEIRRRLGIPQRAKMVLVSMGGVPDRFEFVRHLPADIDCYVVIPGAEAIPDGHPRIIGLPTHSGFYHPDLIRAADALIGKAGYSTIAETYFAGVPFGHVGRPQYPESEPLARFIDRNMQGCPITPEDYASGRWINALETLLDRPRIWPEIENGAVTVGRIVCDMLL